MMGVNAIRSMSRRVASLCALLCKLGGGLALTGFHYSAVTQTMTSMPESPSKYFWSTGYAWGVCRQNAGGSGRSEVCGGSVTITRLHFPMGAISHCRHHHFAKGEKLQCKWNTHPVESENPSNLSSL
jgi:hypothetical protein